MRNRSIANASKDIVVPDLEQVDMISSGGADYNDMCAGCHLSPGVEKTDMSEYLYPSPPNFTKSDVVDDLQTEEGAQESFGRSNTASWHQECLHGAQPMMMIECGRWWLL